MVYKKSRGFSLFELVIAMAIASILVTVAVPSYQGYIKKTRRGDAQGALMGLASAMERYYVDNHTFVGADPATIYSDKSPLDGNETYYELSVTAATRRDFTVAATPKGSQADDKCGQMTVSRTGVKKVIGATLPLEQCWRG